MNWLRTIARTLAQAGLGMAWTSPAGFHVVHEIRNRRKSASPCLPWPDLTSEFGALACLLPQATPISLHSPQHALRYHAHFRGPPHVLSVPPDISAFPPKCSAFPQKFLHSPQSALRSPRNFCI